MTKGDSIQPATEMPGGGEEGLKLSTAKTRADSNPGTELVRAVDEHPLAEDLTSNRYAAPDPTAASF
jgi:hypothetical protein